jgi:8-oxo-dGTP pyrophosphatase MutT (NUDIX family)
MANNFQKFVISQTAAFIRGDKCLILEFARPEGKWGLPGGRMDEKELREPAFRRELKEELGLDDFELLGVADYDIWYFSEDRAVCGIVNLIRNDTAEIKLSPEHVQYKWVTREELGDYQFVWPTAVKLLESGFEFNNLINNKNK